MHTYLPTEKKKEMRKEYIVRLLIVLSAALSVVVLCNIVFMMPAFFNSYSESSQASLRLEELKKQSVSSEMKGIESQIKDIKSITDRFAEGIERPNIVDIIKIGQSARVPGVLLNGFEFTYNASSTVELRIMGESKTRDALILFKKNIESNPKISKVELPVSDLAKSKDLSFTIKILTK